MDVRFDSHGPEPGKDGVTGFRERRILDVHQQGHGSYAAERQQLSPDRTGPLEKGFAAEIVNYGSHQLLYLAMSSRICLLASLQRGMSILVPTTSTTLAAMMEPISPHCCRGIPSEWA